MIYDNKLETINKNPYFNYYQVGISSREPDGAPTHLIWLDNGVKGKRLFHPLNHKTLHLQETILPIWTGLLKNNNKS